MNMFDYIYGMRFAAMVKLVFLLYKKIINLTPYNLQKIVVLW
jgi:hypothetical protein